MKKGTLVLITPDGKETFHPTKMFTINELYDLIDCDIVERVKVRYRGRVRDCYIDERGLLKRGAAYNPKIRELAEAYYERPCQNFVGNAVIWVPNQEITA